MPGHKSISTHRGRGTAGMFKSSTLGRQCDYSWCGPGQRGSEKAVTGRQAAGVPEPPSSPATSPGPAFGSMPGATSSEGRGLLRDPAERRGGRR